MSHTADRAAAETFIWRTARLLERHRYAYQFKDGSATQVLAALQPYQNPDSGFGNALEPDFRGVESQPVLTYTALAVLDEIGQFQGPQVDRVCDYLASV